LSSDPSSSIEIAPQLRTKLAPLDFMCASGTISFWIAYSEVGQEKGGFFFRVSFPNYLFEAGFTPTELYFQRNQYKTSLQFGKTNNAHDRMNCYLIWDPTMLKTILLDPSYGVAISSGLDFNEEIAKRSQTSITPPTIPPNYILEWARRANILPIKTYDTVEDFYQSVLMAIQSIQDKIQSTSMYNAFWNFSYERSTVVNRHPKREPDVSSIIHGLLFDLSLVRSFQVHPEHPLAGGNLDFLVSGNLKNGESANVCIEFKHAHSSKLEHGLTKQLPAYMGAKACNFGIYCILYFRGEHFDNPHESIPEMEFRLKNLIPASAYPDINIVTLNLSHPVPPSRL
jgi:hypothetical protein